MIKVDDGAKSISFLKVYTILQYIINYDVTIREKSPIDIICGNTRHTTHPDIGTMLPCNFFYFFFKYTYFNHR